MNKGKSKKKMNSYLKMVLIMLAWGVVGGIFGFVTSYSGENSIAVIGHGMNAFLLAVRDHTVLLECICGAICIMICEIHFGKMKRMGSQIQDAEDEEYHELQYHIEVSSSWGMIASTVGTVLMMLIISPGYSMKFQEQWLASCDEAEKEEIYEASYKTYLLTGKVLPFCTLVAMLLHMVWNTGVLAIIIPAFLWILSAFNFCRCCVTKKSEKLAK